MNQFNQAEREKALAFLSSTIIKCQAMQSKFAVGSSQYSLLKNRISALCIAKTLLSGEDASGYSEADLRKALPPIASILHKTSKAQSKYETGTKQFARFEPILRAMEIAQSLVAQQLSGEAPF